ncbi:MULTISPECIES: hypothetical protein [unclassified Brucella]|uniref:hypothetical protein n=1 Tax=unclassified Brucella TaxID=2632610 RepID=UPI00217D6176|nr:MULTISPECIES: hypothetical protein [unclassified Brucella]UWF67337.1 hypothetical protein NYO63_04135 [Brucella sp. 1315]UWF70462.1 hypothetical protein NYO65_04135 [Brucella sp. 2594]
MASEPYGMTQEQIDSIAQRCHSYEADDYTMKWGKQTSKYRNSMRKSVRNMLSALEYYGFKIYSPSLAPVDANPLASNPVDDKIAPDTDANAPAATDTGLETGLWLRPIGPHAYATTKDRSTADDWEKYVKVEEYIPRSQAEELLAAKDKTIALAETTMIEMHQELNKLEVDNAALTARIKELEKADRLVSAALWEKKVEAIEAKLAVAQKALEPFAAVLEDYDPEDENDFTPGTLVIGSATNYDITLGDLRKARAVLEGKP